ncbi:hypothetical protein [Streptococcus hyointestinalis]|uniref:hypothetical protein n=1 Tax=Streptococcus hyointestinalis TaxID=1337 RepID=UPI0013DEE0BB|nr:hypothetical protein [Streptococcus hyointestinalis]
MDKHWPYRAKLQYRTRNFCGSDKAGPYQQVNYRSDALTDCVLKDELTQVIIN